MRYSPLVLVALFIDGMQAAISWGIAVIAAFPGTIGGTAIGCAGGSEVAGEIGCWAGGGILGFLGSIPLINGALATVTIPLGIVIGLAINMTLSLVLGGALVFLLMLWGLNPLQKLWWSGAELIPGINNVPCWTFFTISCIWAKNNNKKTRRGILGLATLALVPAQGIMALKEDTGRMLGTSEGTVPRPQSNIGLVQASQDISASPPRQRTQLHDIQPIKPNVQTA